MTIVRYCGDVHGKIGPYILKVRDAEHSVVVGDFGIGFRHGSDVVIDGVTTQKTSDYIHFPSQLDPTNHRFIRGNHDDPNLSPAIQGNIGDGTYEIINDYKVLYVGGARSIDAAHRQENISWWRDEELTQAQLNAIIDRAIIEKPDVLITHEAPEFLVQVLQAKSAWKGNYPSITRQAFEALLDYVRPKLWIFGHWHQSLDYKDSATDCRFICLNELETTDIDYGNNLKRLGKDK